MQKRVTIHWKGRMIFVLVIFGILVAVLIAQLFRIQIVNGEMYQYRAAVQQTRSTNLEAERGTIYDRNGTTLAVSATVWNVCISPAEIDKETLPQVAEKLAELIGTTPEHIIEQASDTKSYYKRIQRRVSSAVRSEVLKYITDEENGGKNKISGVFFENDTKRYYPYGSLASTVLGFTNYDNHGAYGLEAYYDKVLSGTPGMVVSAKNAWGSDMPFKNQQMNKAENGNSIVLTIDEGIQHFVERNLETAIVEHAIGNRATAIVMNVKTGEILAMATKHDFDPNDPKTLTSPAAVQELAELQESLDMNKEEDKKIYQEREQELQYDQWRNKAISDPYEPGSVYKIITASTAVDNKVVSLGDHFYCGGEVEVADHTYGCWHHAGHGDQDFTKAMQNSCNPAFIAIGQRIGARLTFDYMDNFGFGQPTGIDLPGEADGILHSYELLSKPGMIELSSTSFGQTFKATPLQMITACSAAVNGGKLMQPYIVKQVLDAQGNVVETTQPQVKRQVISEESSATMRGLVEAVVDGGSGRYAAIPGYRIGGKTGTSEKKDTNRSVNVLSFIGFAPMEDPQYACLVVLDEPQLDNVFGSVIAAPVVGAIFQEMLPYVGLEPAYTEEERAVKEVKIPNLVYQKPHDAQATLTGLGLKTRIVGVGPSVIRQIPLEGQTISKGMTVTLYTDEDSISKEITVPDVVGLSAQQANQAIVTEAGLNIELRGVVSDGVSTVVVEQWPLAGTTAQPGEVVIITLDVRQEEAEPAAAEAEGVTAP